MPLVQCINISNELKKKFSSLDFKFGAIFYRDTINSHSDESNIFIIIGC